MQISINEETGHTILTPVNDGLLILSPGDVFKFGLKVSMDRAEVRT